jgi:hypothetical protein
MSTKPAADGSWRSTTPINHERELAEQKEALKRRIQREGTLLNLEIQKAESREAERDEAGRALAEALQQLAELRVHADAKDGNILELQLKADAYDAGAAKSEQLRTDYRYLHSLVGHLLTRESEHTPRPRDARLLATLFSLRGEHR